MEPVTSASNPEAALAKLLEIANALEADHAKRLSVGAINHAFLTAGGNGAEYGAAMHRAVADGWLETHPSGAYGPRRATVGNDLVNW